MCCKMDETSRTDKIGKIGRFSQVVDCRFTITVAGKLSITQPTGSPDRNLSENISMKRLNKLTQRLTLLTAVCLVTFTSSGCTLARGFLWDHALVASKFWKATPIIPVSPYFSQLIEDSYWEEERYNRVPILDPVEGENAPLFCQDPPSEDEVMRALPDDVGGGLPFVAETVRNNVRIVVEPCVDHVGECRFYPMAGPAKLHKCHYKCTVYYDKVKRSDWPIPFTTEDATVQVVYIDHDHLIRCAGGPSDICGEGCVE